MFYESWVSINSGRSEGFDKAESGLENVSKEIGKRIQKAIVDELTKRVDAAKNTLLGSPTHGAKHTGLRERVAADAHVTEFNNSGGMAFVTSPGEDMGSIPWGLDLTSRGWRHPVFGNRKKWVSERGTTSWWEGNMVYAEPNLEEKIPEVIQEVIDESFG